MRLTLAVLGALLILVGCDEDPAPMDAAPMDASAVDAGTDLDAGAPRDAESPDAGPPPPGSCFDGVVETSQAGGVVTARTPHYEVEAQAELERAERFAAMLEAAYPELVTFFGADPMPTGRLRVRFFADQPAFEAGLMEDGLGSVGEAGGYYEPSNQTAYLHDQPTRYYTRVLLLHEAVHQLHELTRTATGLPFWYIEGTAEYLARHDWDGRCVRLGVRPLLSQEDTPADALAELEAGSPALDDVVSEAVTASRPVAQSIFRYLANGGGGANRDAFDAFRAAVDSGAAIEPSFMAELGAPRVHDAPWLAFLRGDQEPMSVVFLEWTHVSATSVIGSSPMAFSVARLKQPVSEFELAFEPPPAPGWSAGVLLGYEDNSRWEALVVRDTGRLSRFDVDGGALWNEVGPAPAAIDEGYRFEVAYSPGRVNVTINGMAMGFDTELPAVSGPAVDSATVTFTDIAWR